MTEISNNLVESLKIMGLTEYEAKVYSVLVLFDRAEAKKIYEYLGMPKPSVYQSLKGLMDKGLVMLVSSKPAIYRAVSPKIAIKHLSEVHENAEKTALSELKYLEENVVETENPNIIWTLFGENNLEHSLEELIRKAHTSMKLILPSNYLNYLDFVSDPDLEIQLMFFGDDVSLNRLDLKNIAVHNGYKLDISDFGSLSEYFEKNTLPSEQYSEFTLVLIDDEEMMYVPAFPENTKSGVTSKNPYLINMVNLIFGAVWEHTPELKIDKI